nr:hypothetical protein [Tanacetum cinerariifolium]
MNFIEKCIVERANHEQELQNGLKRLNERELQIQSARIKATYLEIKAAGQGMNAMTKAPLGMIRTSDLPVTWNQWLRCVVEKVDSNVIPDSPDMCDNDIQTNQNVEDEQTSRTMKESNSIRDSCLIALQNKQTEFERYKAFNDRTVDYDKLKRKLNETLGLLAQKEIDIKEGLKLKAYEISSVKEKHDELIKQSLLTKSHYEGLVKEKTKSLVPEKTDISEARASRNFDMMTKLQLGPEQQRRVYASVRLSLALRREVF